MTQDPTKPALEFDDKAAQDKGAELACVYGSGFNATSNQIFNIQIGSFIDGSRWQFDQDSAALTAANERIKELEASRQTLMGMRNELQEIAQSKIKRIAELEKENEVLLKAYRAANSLIMANYPDDGLQQKYWLPFSEALAQKKGGKG